MAVIDPQNFAKSISRKNLPYENCNYLSHTNITQITQFFPQVTPWVFHPWATAQPIPKMPAGQCVEPLSNGHKKISFNSPPTPNRTRNTINECYLGKKGACDTPPFRVKTPLLGGTTINSFANDYGNLANLSISNAKFHSSQSKTFRIFLPLRNYVKLIFRNCRTSKTCNFDVFRGSQF